MNSINKNKFLTELGRLLTFMYEEDRQTALDMYGKMFNDAVDEQALVQFLVSPTRQAVVLARTYNAKERKLQVHAQPKSVLEGEEPEALPEFILAIDQIQQEAAEAQGISTKPKVPADQYTFFEDNVHPQPEAIGAAGAEQARDSKPYSVSETETKTVPAAVPTAAATVVPAAVAAATSEKTFAEAPAEVHTEAPAEAPAEAHTEAPAEIHGEVPAQQPAETKDESPDKVDAFVEDFSIKDDKIFSESDEPEQPREMTTAELKPVMKPRVLLLILYIIIAVPITLIGVALLLVPTLLFLAFAAAAIIVGSLLLAAAFSGFAVFADIVVVLGAALVVLALGLFLLWTFIWFIGGVIVGFINSVIRLGGKWCYKEVLAE